MKVMQVRMDETTYEKVEQEAIHERKSMTAVVTEALSQHFEPHGDVVFLNGSNKTTTAAPAKSAAI